MIDAWNSLSGNFSTTIDALQQPNIEPELAPRGLTGEQLVFKLSICGIWAAEETAVVDALARSLHVCTESGRRHSR
jgi:hypothetical protein